MRLRIGVAMLSCAGLAAAQHSPAFDVATIRPNTSGDVRQSMLLDPRGLLADRNVSLRDLIYQAYGLRVDGQLRGAPAWAGREHYDIDAKAETEADADRLLLMLQQLLHDRFGLSVHRETRLVGTYALRAADASKLTRAKPGDCAPPPRGFCGGFRAAPGRATGRAVSMERLARFLSGPRAGRLVTDATGLSGEFDIDLQWTPEAGRGPSGFDAPVVDPDGPALVTALREQLGLALEPATGPLEVVVVDRVHKPTEN